MAISRSCLLIAILFIFVKPSKAQNTNAEALLDKAYLNVQDIFSGHLGFMFSAKKRLDIDTRENDTVTKFGTFDFVFDNNEGERVITAYILVVEGIKTYIYFNDTCYEINHADRTLKREKYVKKPLWPLSVYGLTLVEAIVQGGERIEKLKDRTTDTGYFTSFLADTMLNDKEQCYVIQIMKNDDDIEDDMRHLYSPSYHKKLCITKQDSFLLTEYHTHINFGFKFYWNEQVTDRKINCYAKDEIKLKAKKLLEKYKDLGYSYPQILPNVEREKQAQFDGGLDPIKKGDIAPDFSLAKYGYATDTFQLHNVSSKYILLDFWYASCAPCLQDIPHIKKYASTYNQNDLAVYGINVYDKDTTRIKAIDDRYHFNYPILINGATVAHEVYGYKGFPLKMLIDGSSKKVLYVGKGHSLKKGSTELDLLLQQLLGH